MATAKGPRTQRYRPASEFDNATLAKKREYWRTKKREQRAKVAAVRKKLGVENARNCDARRNALSVHGQNAVSGHTLLNSDGSYQTNMCDSSESGLLAPSYGDQVEKTAESEVLVSGGCVPGSSQKLQNASPGQRVRWFQEIKLSRVLPKFQDGSGASQSGAMGCRKVVKKSTAGPLVISNTSAKFNGSLLNTNTPVPAVRVTVHPAATVNHRVPSRIAAANGTSSVKMCEQNLPQRGVPGLHDHKRTQISVQMPHKASPLNVTNRVGVHVKRCPSGVSSANMKTKPCALATKLNTSHGEKPPETEEERAAKRREMWRIKKREQRAKRAAKIAKDRERIQRVDVSARGAVQSVRVTHNSPRLSRQGPKQAVNPVVHGSQMRRQNCALAVSGPIPKNTDTAITKKSFGFSMTNHVTIDPKPPSVVVKTVDPKQTRAFYTPPTATASCVMSTNMNLGQGITCAPKGVTAQYTNTAKSTVRPRIQTNTFIRNQRFFVHRNTRMSLSPFRENPEETAEERMARKREYWRIKKREQRAKLSAEVKAKLRERDSLLRRVKRYQFILEEMRRARAENQKAQQSSRVNTINISSEPIGGFIKEDGTVTTAPTLQKAQTPSSAIGAKSGVEKVSPSKPLLPISHCTVPTSRGCGSFAGNLSANPPPLQKRAVPQKNSCAVRVSVQTPPKLVCIRPRPVSNNHYNRFTNPTPSISQITVSAPNHVQSMINDTTNFKRIGSAARPVGTVSATAECSPNEELTEEERIARRREYWRIKKREQRANRAARLRQGLLRGRAMAAKRRRQNQIAASSPCVSSQSTNTNPPVPLNASTTRPTPPSTDALATDGVKQEQELSVKEEVNPPLEQPLCSDIKPTLTPPPEPQSEADSSGSADAQATTLLAVASMKRLLEESLSTVASSDTPEPEHIKREEPQCKTEDESLPDEGSETPNIKPDPVSVPVEEPVEAAIPGSICFSAEDANLQTAENSGCQTHHQPSPLLLNPHSSQDTTSSIYTASCLDVAPSSASITIATSFCPPQQPPCSETSTALDLPQTVQSFCSTRAKLKPSCSLKASNPQLPGHQQQHGGEVSNESSILQRKREYWRFMKRQQRARKAQEKRAMQPQRPAIRTPQASNFASGVQRPAQSSYSKASLPPSKSLSSACTLQSKTCFTAVNPLPTVHVVSPPVSDASKQPIAPKLAQPRCVPRADLQGLPACGNVRSPTVGSRDVPPPIKQSAVVAPSGEKTGPLLLVENQRGSASGHMRGVRSWSLQVPPSTSMPPAATLGPTHNLRPSKPVSSVSSVVPPLNNNNNTRSPGKHPEGLGPHKSTQGAVEDDDIMRRKREYWRVKKKEQRARKAARERGFGHLNTPPTWEPVHPTHHQLPHNVQSQDSRQWYSSSEETDLALSSPVDTDLGYLNVHDHAEPVKDELVFQDDGEDDGDPSRPGSGAWRNRYLMDYDPLNQLLVCMVCGEQQYSHSPEGTRAHIEDAHPETLSLGPQERQRIQEAWDEQVAQREQFFTSQLQQRSTAHTEDIAEVEVTVDMDDDFSQSTHSKSAKTKNPRNF